MDLLHIGDLVKLPLYAYRYCKYAKRTLIGLDLGIYWFWAALRIALTLLPQTGYIHPDEYFQTVEVFAGNAFGTEVSLPWEFNTSFPIRSVPLIYATLYVPFSLLRRLSDLTELYFGFQLTNHYLLLVVPRLSMCLLSFISDICLFKICYAFCQNYKERLIIYASSYVCLVFMTRTFSNTVEITCFNVLLCLVASCMAESEKVIYQSDFLEEKYNEAGTIHDQVKVKKLMKLLPKHSLKKCIPITIATVSGFFNRPTFVLFAFTPLFYWFQRGLNLKSSFLKDFHMRIFLFILYCIPVVCFFIYFDSAYYGYFTWVELFHLEITTDNFVVTPLNFIKYNIDSRNLSKHGLHSRFLHVLVNIPLLFNVLGLSGLLVIAKLLYRGSLSNWTLLPKSQSITGMMTLSVIVPVLGLSLFPHQEPRFITPILLPLIFLYSHIVRDFEEDCKSVVPFRKRHPKHKELEGIFKYPFKCISYFEKATENIDNRYNISGRYLAKFNKQDVIPTDGLPKAQPAPQKSDENNEKEKKKKSNSMIKYWHLLNAVCVLFFGFLHQGGVYGLTKAFHNKLVVKPKYLTYNLVTSHTYSLPYHLLNFKVNYKYKNTKFIAFELGSESIEKINLKLTTILRISEAKKKEKRRDYKVFYALPSSLLHEFMENHSHRNFTCVIQQAFYPHFSSEAPPHFLFPLTSTKGLGFSGVWGLLNHFDILPVRYLVEFLKQFSLTLIEVKLN